MYYHWVDAELILNCRIQTRAGKDSFAEVSGDVLKVKITAAPVDGEANQHLIRFLSRQFKVPQKQIRILMGTGSRNKRIAISGPGMLPPELGIEKAV